MEKESDTKYNEEGGEDMETQITEREKFLQKCPFCDEKPAGFGIEALKFNFKTHLEKHLRKGEISESDISVTMEKLLKSIKENGKE